MGLYQALISSKNRFSGDLPPLGYSKKPFHWNIEFPINENDAVIVTGPFRGKDAKSSELPDRQRSGQRTSTENIKPYLTSDQEVYVLSSIAEKSTLEHTGFLNLHKDLLAFCLDADSDEKSEIVRALSSCVKFLESTAVDQRKIFPSGLKEKDTIRFVTKTRAFSDFALVQEFWARRLGELQACEHGICGICTGGGDEALLLKTMPVPLRLFDYLPALSSFNASSYNSQGKEQLNNSPICVDCGMAATAVLSYLIRRDGRSGKHALVIAEENKRSGVARPLSNQLAVFWTSEKTVVNESSEVEDIIRLTIDDVDGIKNITNDQNLPEPDSANLKALLESPWRCRGEEVTAINPVGFYFAILSPNKSRLVIREWIETNVGEVKRRLIDYRQALSIINPQSGEMIVPPLRAILQSLRSPSSKKNSYEEKPRLAEIEPELLRQMIRCMYQGSEPPFTLLTRAVQAFRMPVAAADEYSSFDRLCARRTTLAAAMKLVLTYKNQNDRITMEKLTTERDLNCSYKGKVPYLCGRLLALLNEIQYRASSSRKGVNTTLVDKYYAAASTAPNTVFGSMLKLANTAHLPKIRKDPQRNYAVKCGEEETPIRLSDLLNEVVGKIDSAERLDTSVAFPKQLNQQQQAEFALGYHHQQAVLNPHTK